MIIQFLIASIVSLNVNYYAQNEALVGHGKAIFNSTCTVCHNRDPRKPGAIGPDIAWSSKELVEARVLHSSYPPGYTPKRKTHIMPRFPQLKDDVEAIAAYLNSIPKDNK